MPNKLNQFKLEKEPVAYEEHGTTIKDSTVRREDKKVGVGQRLRKIEGGDKATGKSIYTDDIILPRMLHCKIKRSTKAHAKIISIDLSRAEKLQGVHAVITGEDLPEKYGIIPWTRDENALCVGKVRHIGDAVCAVAATSEEIANRAVRLIKVTYEDLPPILNTAEAAKTGDVPETKVNVAARRGNVTKHVDLKFGDVEQAFKDSDVIVENDFYFHQTTHAAIEPHCAIGDYDKARKKLTVYSATQVPHYLHRDLAEVLGLEHKYVRVVQPVLGGAFGGKSEPFDLEFVVAKLSMKTGRPVKCLYTREEVFYAHRGRHPMKMHFKCGASKTGIIKAVQSDIDIDGGAYASFGLITAYYAGQLLTGPVGMENYAFKATRYYTNKPACGPKRGHGSVQPRFAYDVHLDMIAEQLKMSPFEIRRKNFVGEHTDTVNGMRIGSSGLNQCLDMVYEASDWQAKHGSSEKKLEPNKGMGLATSMYISGTNYPIYPNEMPQSGVQLTCDRSGMVRIFSGASDLGQGCNSVLATICVEELGVELDDVKVVTGDTDLTPIDLGAYSSRVTMMMGHAAQEACRKMREKIQTAVAAHYNSEAVAEDEVLAEDILLAKGKVTYSKDTAINMSTRDAFWLAEAHFGTLGTTGGYRTTERGGKYRGGTIGASPAYSCTAHVAEVEVDLETGQVKICKIWAAHDCGRALNPTLVEGQIEGSTYMGAAEVTMENMAYGDETGVRAGMLLAPNLLDYRIPTTLDTPAIQALIVEAPDPNGPYGAKEAGEGPLHSAIPAIANAIYEACGVRLFELPFSPHKILKALEEKAENKVGATC